MNPEKEKISVWIIDDVDHVRLAIRESVKETDDIQCTEGFGDCESALKFLREKQDPPDVILLDIGLPGMDGLEGIKHFKRLSPSTKIVMLTVYDKDKDIYKAMKEGAAGYILKDSSFSLQSVTRAIRDAEKDGVSLDPSVAKKVVEMLKSTNPASVDYRFTDREKEVVSLITRHLTMQEIAKTLKITYNTVTAHVRNIHEKMNVHRTGEVIERAIKEHLT